MDERDLLDDQDLVDRAADQFVRAICEGRLDDAADAATLAFGVARLAEAEDPTARSRW